MPALGFIAEAIQALMEDFFGPPVAQLLTGRWPAALLILALLKGKARSGKTYRFTAT